MKHVAIIGNGIAGVTAARYIRKMSDYAITMISAESKHFFSRTALMYVYMGHMRFQDIKPYEDWFWDKNRINLIQAYVESVDSANKKLQLSNGKDVVYDILIIASGSRFNKFGWKGQNLEGVGGLYSLQDLEYMEYYTKDAERGVIVGGGLIGIEMAEMMASRGIDVTFLVREKSYWDNILPPGESQMISRHIREHHMDLKLETELAEIVSDDAGRVRAVITNKGEEIACQWVGLTAGVRPNTGFLKDSGIEMERGILVSKTFETNVPDHFAIGDCAQYKEPPAGRRNIEQIWYTGKMHGETVAMNICGTHMDYNPGIFFNSAKFLDIEYQIYGDVPAKQPEDINSLYWEDQKGHRAIRINYEKESGTVKGFHLMGVRYRHLVCERWLAAGANIEEVLKNLAAANFDPEFFTTYESAVVKRYNQQNGTSLRLNKAGSLRSLIFGRRNDGRKQKNTVSTSKK
ncbi:MAG TPA: NAD(P)/FAD-dependent oxidoreductase [Bacteroidetes bacterium]|nr:NAD(P)/FAD-dependent oxidoreductase [Bacteroidota bacterium]